MGGKGNVHGFGKAGLLDTDQGAFQPRQIRAETVDIAAAAAAAARNAEPYMSLPYIDEPRRPGPDSDYLEKKEGARKLKGYVPTYKSGKVVGKSGVTVASGFDLGQHDDRELRAMGFFPGLRDRLRPYMTKKLQGQAALNFVKENPVSITNEEARMIDRRAQTHKYDRIAGLYNAATARNYGPGAPRFEDLPSRTQTAIIGLSYQHGHNLAVATPDYWGQITSGQWQAAQDNLWNFGDAFETRRREEAELLKLDIAAGRLPAPPRKMPPTR